MTCGTLRLDCGGVVFLYDAANIEAIKRARPPRDDLFDVSLGDAAFAQALADDGLCAAISLGGRDPDFTAELSVGRAFTPDQLAAARWLRPQHTRLSLPSGRLCIDTPFSIPLDAERPEPDEADDDNRFSAQFDVPAGDYLLTVYRIDWAAMKRDKLLKGYKGQEHLLSLTPLVDSPEATLDGAVLACPDPEPDRSWIGNYTISGNEFACQILFWDFRSWFRLNLDRAAIRQLGLKTGDVIHIEAAELAIDAIFLDCEPVKDTAGYAPQKRHDETLAAFRTRYGKDRLAKETANRPEFALGSWNRCMEQEILGFHRDQSKAAIPKELHEVWILARGRISNESFQI